MTQPEIIPKLVATFSLANGYNRSCSERKSCHKLVRCQNFGKSRTSENQAGQRVSMDPERTQPHEQRWRGVQLTDSI